MRLAGGDGVGRHPDCTPSWHLYVGIRYFASVTVDDPRGEPMDGAGKSGDHGGTDAHGQ